MKTVVRNSEGKPFSAWKPAEKFAYGWQQEGIPGTMEAEFIFAPDRNWRMDFAWPSVKLAVEIDGFGFGHQAQQCMAQDNEKANAAVELGWRVLRYNTRQLGSKAGVADAVEQVARVLCSAK